MLCLTITDGKSDLGSSSARSDDRELHGRILSVTNSEAQKLGSVKKDEPVSKRARDLEVGVGAQVACKSSCFIHSLERHHQAR